MERLRKIGFSKLTALEDALNKLSSHIKLSSVEEIETVASLNRILADDITSEIDIPPFDRSAMDGYAVKAEDIFEASLKNPKKIKKVGIIEIGESPTQVLKRGEAIRISTGAAMPDGADAVIKIEDTEIENDLITIYTSLVPGKNVSKKGEDIPLGTQILNQGVEIKAEHIALLSSLGIEKINVRKNPKISVFATGNELLEVGTPLEKNKIFNSNTPMISNLVQIYGGKVIKESTLKDNRKILKTALIEAVKDSNIVIFTGGTSVGTKDHLPEVIHENGTVLTHGIAMRPGSPILIGYLKDTLVFCLPGTPVAAYLCFLVIVGPTIRKMMGCSKIDPRIEINAIINKDVPISSLGYINYLRVKIEKIKNHFIAIPVKLKGSGIISSLTKSDGIIEIQASQEGLKNGDQVTVKLHPT
ncbi:MAG: gephyrin-like molybdotransferase Glp [Candidatus Hodarchaeota archaeon]